MEKSLLRGGADLRAYAGIAEAISAAIHEIVETGTLKSLEKLRATASPELVSMSHYPRLDPRRVLRIYKKLGISTVEALRSALDSGQIASIFGARMAQHARYGPVETQTILLYNAHTLSQSVSDYFFNRAGAQKVEAMGDYRRRVEIVSQLDFIVQARNFKQAIEAMKRYGGRTPVIESTETTATFSLPAGPLLCLTEAQKRNWGLVLIRGTGSAAHLRKLTRITGDLAVLEAGRSFSNEEAFYKHFGMQFIPPELREGLDELGRSRRGALPQLISPFLSMPRGACCLNIRGTNWISNASSSTRNRGAASLS